MCGRLLFRVDAGEEIGAGHLMRCLAIAAEWESRGGESGFLMYRSTDKLNERISNEGFDIIQLPSEKLSDVTRACRQYSAQMLLIDGYHFNSVYRGSLQKCGIPVVLMDDSIIEPPWYADLIINPQPNASASDYVGMPNDSLLLGLDYLPIRQEFRRQHELGILPIHKRRHILLTFGGTDPLRLTLAVTKRIVSRLPKLAQLDIIISKDHVDYPSLIEISASMPEVVHIHSDVDNMAELMGKAGLALSAAGSTIWELAALHVPVIAIIVAENQQVVSRYSYWSDLIDARGDMSEHFVDDVIKRTLNLWQDEALRRENATKLANLKLLSGSANICSRLCHFLHNEA